MASIKLTKAAKVRKYAAAHPEATATQIAKATKVQLSYVYNIINHDRARMAKHKDLAPVVQRKLDEMKPLRVSNELVGDIAHRAGQGRIIEVSSPSPIVRIIIPKTWFQRLKSAIFP
jgi:hypothetical protein